MKNRMVCSVRGKDFRGYLATVLVEAYSLYEAAALAMDQLVRDGASPCDREVTVHRPATRWKVTPVQLSRWVAEFGTADNIGRRDLKRRLHDFLKTHLRS